MMLIALCPLAKIFQPRFTVHEDGKPPLVVTLDTVMEEVESDRIWKKERFSIQVPRSAGDVIMYYDRPKMVTNPDLFLWLSGGEDGSQSRETDWTGIVMLNFTDEIQDSLNWYLANGKRLPPELDAEVASLRAKAAELSERRCMTHVTKMHEHLKAQREHNKENKVGDSKPSATEYLCAYVMKKSELEKAKKEQIVRDSFEQLMT